MILEQRIEELEIQIALLLKENSELKAELSRLRCPRKDSSNSSLPPSQDPYRVKRTESLREKTGRKAGGQQGHEGTTLQMSATPDQTVDHQPSYCTVCGNSLSHIPGILSGRRQEIDIPPVHFHVTEHRVYTKVCSCGHHQKGDYPPGVHSAVCYGENLSGIAAYLHARQYIPFERMQEMFRDLFSVEISTGTLVNLVQGFAARAGKVYRQIRERLINSRVVGADETGVCVNGCNRWAWTFQNERLTYITVEESRGRKAIDRIFENGLPHTILVHDCWKPYFRMDVHTHQICIAHLLRELKYLDKSYADSWTKSFTGLLLDALQLKRTLQATDYLTPIPERKKLEDRLDALLEEHLNPEHKKLVVFRERINQYRDYLFTFLYRKEVPPDNNGSERAVRTFKVKQKVSGLFRSSEGAQAFAVIRSVIDTTIKNGQNVFQALVLVAKATE